MEGYTGLLLSAFLAATILPLSSEVMLAAMALSGVYATFPLWAFATAGNFAGAVVNWGLGRYCLHFQGRRWFPVSRESLEKSQRYFLRYGVWSLLFAWLPLVGDPLTLVAGLLRVPLLPFTVLVLLGKGARYGVVLWLLPA